MLKTKKNKKPLLVACDVYRPAAIEQLRVLAEQIGVPIYSEPDSKNPVKIAENAIQEAKAKGYDGHCRYSRTSGSRRRDDERFAAIKKQSIKRNPIRSRRSMTGEGRCKHSKEFNERLDFNGVVLTKLDGDTRGGAALSIRSVVNKPIKFVGTGEKLDAIDQFHPSRMFQTVSLVWVTSFREWNSDRDQYDAEETKRLQKKIAKNQFDFNDFLSQIAQIKRWAT